ncbi:GNAT family N-acetyltransferase [Bacillus luteolus]|uniref:GNAT family N-acetyltransferase n=1 Tax=Litchfieldia luteola TaxID=682179 RepID=A0ABR9QJ56_9BACI|nr:GNAT family N-acetyltransferase [Cytobacillus luteolus]MBE4908533.1 GNAT family N-acetyltransferase [Cytobacillus luteolus]MBP1941385.1 putative GNAT family N-acyltransferase [Cytobacillus luteolus]
MVFKVINEEDDLQKAFDIRKEVFVKEQGVPLADEYDEFDTLSSNCKHILVFYNDKPVGTGRLRVVNDYGKLERICILESYRKYGLGKTIIKSLEEIATGKNVSKLKLHGQTHAEGFYEKLGYHTTSEIFIEDGIPHIIMEKEL